ncbi:MAG TPA: DNA-directed RNA polymerase subunit alpha [Chloroflexi bacterium]|nr:DNA-directed RNA polymerase subunit alpha [Chloroflexota bacterium]
MLNQVLPKIECEANTQTYGRFAVGPMNRGYGVTIGVALRRVLLSSLPGAAITSVRVSGVPHEFTEIPGAKEDMIMLILNLKKVRLMMHTEEPVRMRVTARGKSVITAGDIEAPSSVEIVNPELQLLTLDTLESELELELTAERGVGYSPAEDRKALPIGQIPVDAIYSPIVRVNTEVEAARIEQITDYDLLKLEIWTDGTVHPSDALSEAARILMRHFAPISQFSAAEAEEAEIVEEEREGGAFYDVPIEDLDLAMRAYNCLKRAGITKVGEILERLERGPAEILAIRNFGQKSLAELLDRMREKGFLPEDYELEA